MFIYRLKMNNKTAIFIAVVVSAVVASSLAVLPSLTGAAHAQCEGGAGGNGGSTFVGSAGGGGGGGGGNTAGAFNFASQADCFIQVD